MRRKKKKKNRKNGRTKKFCKSCKKAGRKKKYYLGHNTNECLFDKRQDEDKGLKGERGHKKERPGEKIFTMFLKQKEQLDKLTKSYEKLVVEKKRKGLGDSGDDFSLSTME